MRVNFQTDRVIHKTKLLRKTTKTDQKEIQAENDDTSSYQMSENLDSANKYFWNKSKF